MDICSGGAENRAVARGRDGFHGERGSRGGKVMNYSRGEHTKPWAHAVSDVSSSNSATFKDDDCEGVPISTEQWQHLMKMFADGKHYFIRWMIDSGCSHHLSGKKSVFIDRTNITPSSVGLPNGTHAPANQANIVILSNSLHLNNVYMFRS